MTLKLKCFRKYSKQLNLSSPKAKINCDDNFTVDDISNRDVGLWSISADSGSTATTITYYKIG